MIGIAHAPEQQLKSADVMGGKALRERVLEPVFRTLGISRQMRAVRITPYGFRRGGINYCYALAVESQMPKLEMVALLMVKGRWRSPRSLYTYLCDLNPELAAFFRLTWGRGGASLGPLVTQIAGRLNSFGV
jgi:hypothetical protein